MNPTIRSATAAMLATMLSACGGGGDGGDSGPRARPSFTIGGSVSGLSGSGLVLQKLGSPDLAISANGAFTFPGTTVDLQGYAVGVGTQPTNPSQTCVVANGMSAVMGANVTNIAVTCTTNTYRVGGTVTGLAGAGLTLQNNGGNELVIDADGAFQFSAAVPSNGAYAATITAQPTSPWQTCVVGDASGTVTNANVTTITVTCTTDTFALRGSVSGLSPSQFREPLVLSNGSNEVEVMDNGTFTMANVTSGQAYDVEVKTQPTKPTLQCRVEQGSGTVANAEITEVAVTCEPTGATFAYVTSYLPTLSVLKIEADHSLQVVEAMLMANTPTAVVTDPSGQFVYVATLDQAGTVLAYSIDPATGKLAQIGSGIVTGASPNHIVVDPAGEFVFVANEHGGLTSQGSVSVFAVDAATGGLTEVPGSEFTHGLWPREIAIDPSGRFVYTADTTGDTAGYRVERETGTLVPLAGSPFPALDFPVSIVVDPRGRFVYSMSGSLTDGIDGYAIDPDSGVLTPLPGSPFGSGSDRRIVVHPSGKFLYNLDGWSTHTIKGYAIADTGALTPLTGFPLAEPRLPDSGAFDPTGRFLYLAVEAGDSGGMLGGVKVFGVDTVTGALSDLSPIPLAIANNPTSIAVR
jgi:6-phosphogluconolactonase (cycloisomerase 2 family)